MGATERLPAVGVAHLELASKRVFAGHTLRGAVRVQLDHPLEHATVSVKIVGTQRLGWVTFVHQFGIYSHNKTHDALDVELFLTSPNATLAAGQHEFPFEFELPADLIANASRTKFYRRHVHDMGDVVISFQYMVSATVESAGLTNDQLHKQEEIFIGTMPTAVPITPIDVTTTEDLKRLGMGRPHTCTLRVMNDHNVFELPHGVIGITVEVDLPPQRALKSVKLFLFETVFVDREADREDGEKERREEERLVCSQKYRGNVFSIAEGTPQTLRAILQMQIEDVGGSAAGGPVAATFMSHFLAFRHRIVVDVSFGMGSRMTATSPVVLIDAVPIATPVAPNGVGMTP